MSHKVFYRLASVFLALAISFTEVIPAGAAAGALDSTFDGDGMVFTPIAAGTADDQGKAVAVQPDGRIVVAGFSDQGVTSADFALARYNSDGSLDTSFDADGIVTTDFGGIGADLAFAIALQPDGKIIAAGISGQGVAADFALARYNSDGSPDTTFDGDGKVMTDLGTGIESAFAVALQLDGKIVLAGHIDNGVNSDNFALTRYNSDGSLDTTFDTDGKLTTDFGSRDIAWTVAIQPDGKIIAAGDSGIGAAGDFALARYNIDGSLDTTFDSDGKVTTDISGGLDTGAGIAIQSDTKIIVAGTGSIDFALARYNSDGSLDPSFDSDGKVTTDFNAGSDFGNAVVLQSDGKIVMAGNSEITSDNDFALARYNSNGSLDTSFDSDGKVTTAFDSTFFDSAEAVAIQPDGKIVAAGTSPQTGSDFDFAVARYDSADLVVEIDVKPGKFPNRIELENNICSNDDDDLRVAVLTTPTVAALLVDDSTVELGDPLLSGTATPINKRKRDVDLDGDMDLVLVFSLCDLITNPALDLNSTELLLTGISIDGFPFTGTDSVMVVQDN